MDTKSESEIIKSAMKYWKLGHRDGFGEVWAIHMRTIVNDIAERGLTEAFSNSIVEYHIGEWQNE